MTTVTTVIQTQNRYEVTTRDSVVTVNTLLLQPATATRLGLIKLAGDLGGTAEAPTVINVTLSAPLSPANGGTGVNNGSNALTIPATGTAVLKTGTPTTGRMAEWASATNVQESTLVKSGAGVLTLSAGSAYTFTVPKTGTAVVGTGTAGRVAEWVTDANTLQASSLAKTGAGVLTLDAGGAYTLTIPATGTVALLATANVFTANQRINALLGVNVAPVAQLDVLASATTVVPLLVDSPTGQTADLIQAAVNNVAKFFVDATGKINSAVATALFGAFTLTIGGTSTVNGSLVGSMTGSGTVATGGFTLTVPATGTAALKGASITAGRIAYWGDANTVSDTGLIKTGAGVLTLDAGGAYTLTVPATGTVALLATANVFTADQTITKASARHYVNATSGNPAIVYQVSGVDEWAAYYNVSGGYFSLAESGVADHFRIANATGVITTLATTMVFGSFTLTVPATGTVALLATANVFTANQRVSALLGVNDAPTTGEQVRVLAGATTTVPMVLLAPTSQTADLLQAKVNSVLKARIDKDGFVEAPRVVVGETISGVGDSGSTLHVTGSLGLNLATDDLVFVNADDTDSTKTTPTAVQAWVEVTIAGATHYIPAYTSKTA